MGLPEVSEVLFRGKFPGIIGGWAPWFGRMMLWFTWDVLYYSSIRYSTVGLLMERYVPVVYTLLDLRIVLRYRVVLVYQGCPFFFFPGGHS